MGVLVCIYLCMYVPTCKNTCIHIFIYHSRYWYYFLSIHAMPPSLGNSHGFRAELTHPQLQMGPLIGLKPIFSTACIFDSVIGIQPKLWDFVQYLRKRSPYSDPQFDRASTQFQFLLALKWQPRGEPAWTWSRQYRRQNDEDPNWTVTDLDELLDHTRSPTVGLSTHVRQETFSLFKPVIFYYYLQRKHCDCLLMLSSNHC